MKTTVKELDALEPDQARGVLAECCGAPKWVNEMTAARPFRTFDNLLKAADESADKMDAQDWLEAFSHHPRIGEKAGSAPERGAAAQLAAEEQSGVDAAENDVKAALMSANQEHELKFGYIYIVCATGKSADEMLELARKRLGNDAEKELAVSADEQRKITRLRLAKLIERDDEKGKGAKR